MAGLGRWVVSMVSRAPVPQRVSYHSLPTVVRVFLEVELVVVVRARAEGVHKTFKQTCRKQLDMDRRTLEVLGVDSILGPDSSSHKETSGQGKMAKLAILATWARGSEVVELELGLDCTEFGA